MKTTERSLSEGWTFRQIGPAVIPNSDLATWMTAEVPGHVHLDLERLGVIPDPHCRMYERTVQWVDDADWAYRCTFDVHDGDLNGARHILRFDGLDTIATVVLNDDVLATTDNMFIGHEFDVTDRLTPGTNTVEVRFESAERVGRERLTAADLEEFHVQSGHRHGLTPRSMVRKAQYNWGWDWGPRLRGCGIWRDVTLVRIPAARIEDWWWRADFDGDGRAVVTVDASVDGAEADVEVLLVGHGVDLTSRGSAPHALTIENPQRWWCAGHGDQPLYDLRVTAMVDGDVVDAIETRIGLREVELVRERDDIGESFAFHVNGVPVYAKGANWIPDDSFPARTTRDRVFAQLQMARDCGMNMIRVWGGGLYESSDFYDACDELGLLVWQDFPYACALYPDDDATVEAAVSEARIAVRQLRNRTSLALWCGNNENQALADLGFFGTLPRLLGERIYEEALPAVVADEDPGRAYWTSSPWGDRTDPNGDDEGDCHYWNVWHGAGDWVHYEKCRSRFVSEFGFSAPPDRRTLEEALLPDELGVDTPAMRWHDKTSKGYETYLGFIALHYPIPQSYEDLVYYGQLNQADAMRFGIEHFRRLRPHNMGTLVWQLNDCWPVQSWAWIDHALRPKAAWFAAKRFYAPLLLSLWTDSDGTVKASLVNDRLTGASGTLVVRTFNSDGAVLETTSVEVSVDAEASVVVFEPAVADDAVVIHATFADVESTLLLEEPKDLALASGELEVEIDERDDGTATITLRSDRPVLSVIFWLDDVDATWSDNFVNVWPGSARTIDVRPATPGTVGDRLRWRSL